MNKETLYYIIKTRPGTCPTYMFTEYKPDQARKRAKELASENPGYAYEVVVLTYRASVSQLVEETF